MKNIDRIEKIFKNNNILYYIYYDNEYKYYNILVYSDNSKKLKLIKKHFNFSKKEIVIQIYEKNNFNKIIKKIKFMNLIMEGS